MIHTLSLLSLLCFDESQSVLILFSSLHFSRLFALVFVFVFVLEARTETIDRLSYSLFWKIRSSIHTSNKDKVSSPDLRMKSCGFMVRVVIRELEYVPHQQQERCCNVRGKNINCCHRNKTHDQRIYWREDFPIDSSETSASRHS